MSETIALKLSLFENEQDFARSIKSILKFLEVLCDHNTNWLLKHPSTPTLYNSPVKYSTERGEIWQDIPATLALGSGDCEDLACWRVGELRLIGVKASPYLKQSGLTRGDKTMMHCVVRLPDGRIEDPSRALGMLGAMSRKPVYIDP